MLNVSDCLSVCVWLCIEVSQGNSNVIWMKRKGENVVSRRRQQLFAWSNLSYMRTDQGTSLHILIIYHGHVYTITTATTTEKTFRFIQIFFGRLHTSARTKLRRKERKKGKTSFTCWLKNIYNCHHQTKKTKRRHSCSRKYSLHVHPWRKFRMFIDTRYVSKVSNV